MQESPVTALRKKRIPSIRRAVDAVKNKEADAVVSAGNSGVAMASALFCSRKSKGVDRPAIAATMPTLKGLFVLIDAGANVDCKAENLLQFGLMGSSYCKAIFGKREPRVALLSIGEEDGKGNELTRRGIQTS